MAFHNMAFVYHVKICLDTLIKEINFPCGNFLIFTIDFKNVQKIVFCRTQLNVLNRWLKIVSKHEFFMHIHSREKRGQLHNINLLYFHGISRTKSNILVVEKLTFKCLNLNICTCIYIYRKCSMDMQLNLVQILFINFTSNVFSLFGYLLMI